MANFKKTTDETGQESDDKPDSSVEEKHNHQLSPECGKCDDTGFMSSGLEYCICVRHWDRTHVH